MGKVFERNGNWYIYYRCNGRRIRQKIGTNKKQAENILKVREAEVVENKHLDVQRDKKIKFSDFAVTYMENYSKLYKKSWKSGDENSLKRLVPFFGDKYLYEITPFMVQEYQRIRKEEVSAASVNRELACLKVMFSKALEWGKVRSNPIQKVKFFKEDNTRLDYLTKEEINQLIEACDAQLRPIVITAVYTGMRKGEILNLEWSNIDFGSNTITLLDTKSGKKRSIPMNTLVREAISRVPHNPNGPYVFCHENGSPYVNIRKSFFTAIKRIGRIGFVFHSLRHTFASQLVMSGISLQTVMELLGHSDLRMTLRYSHLSPDHRKRAVEVLASRMSPSCPLDENAINDDDFKKVISSLVAIN